jgi:hypothetical protein
MTQMEVLQQVIRSCDRNLEEQLARTEVLLCDLAATTEELAAAIGPNGFARKMLEADRAEQISAVAVWLSGQGDTLH